MALCASDDNCAHSVQHVECAQMKRLGTPTLQIGGGAQHQTDPVRVRAAERIRPLLLRMSLDPTHFPTKNSKQDPDEGVCLVHYRGLKLFIDSIKRKMLAGNSALSTGG